MLGTAGAKTARDALKVQLHRILQLILSASLGLIKADISKLYRRTCNHTYPDQRLEKEPSQTTKFTYKAFLFQPLLLKTFPNVLRYTLLL